MLILITFSDINGLLSFSLSFFSICPLMLREGCSLISLINHPRCLVRSLIHCNLSVTRYKLGSPHHRGGHQVFDTVIYRQSLDALFCSCRFFLCGVSIIRCLVKLHYLSMKRLKNISLEYNGQEKLSHCCAKTLTDKTAK